MFGGNAVGSTPHLSKSSDYDYNITLAILGNPLQQQFKITASKIIPDAVFKGTLKTRFALWDRPKQSVTIPTLCACFHDAKKGEAFVKILRENILAEGFGPMLDTIILKKADHLAP